MNYRHGLNIFINLFPRDSTIGNVNYTRFIIKRVTLLNEEL